MQSTEYLYSSEARPSATSRLDIPILSLAALQILLFSWTTVSLVASLRSFIIKFDIVDQPGVSVRAGSNVQLLEVGEFQSLLTKIYTQMSGIIFTSPEGFQDVFLHNFNNHMYNSTPLYLITLGPSQTFSSKKFISKPVHQSVHSNITSTIDNKDST